MLDLTTEFKFQLSAAQKQNKELKEKMDSLRVKIFFPSFKRVLWSKKLHFIIGKVSVRGLSGSNCFSFLISIVGGGKFPLIFGSLNGLIYSNLAKYFVSTT